MYYTKEYGRYGYDYVKVGTPATALRQTRRKFEAVRRIHRTLKRSFGLGCTLVLGQFPFSFLGSESLHISTSILGGLLVVVPGAMLAFHYGTGDGIPSLVDAEEAYEQASELYTKHILEEGSRDVG